MSEPIVPRCPECGQAIPADQPRALTAYGWTHLACLPDDFDLLTPA